MLAPPERRLALAHARALLETPTAPYAEDGQLAAVRAFVRDCPGLELRADRQANLIVTWKGRGPKRAPVLAYSAHLDHPGFLYEGPARGQHVFSFHGGVPQRYLPGARIRIFDVETRAACATARIADLRAIGDELHCTLDELRGAPRAGSFAMWDLTPGAIRGQRLHARVCDDLMGAAAILTTLALHARARSPVPLVGIFTRAEETGFVGCQALLRAAELGRELVVIGLECSPRRATAKVGHGPVVRVGDKQSVFEPWITHRLQEVAQDLAAANPRFVYQRALMDGGSCESTAYNLWGTPAGALCLALGNYHNCGPNGRIAAEYVDWDDHESLIALLRATATSWGAARAGRTRLRLNRIWKREYNRLAASARRIRAADRRETRS